MKGLSLPVLPGYVSGSTLGLASHCAPALALPRIRRGGGRDRMGTAFHAHLRERATLSIDDAIARIPLHAAAAELDEREASILAARARQFDWVPPRGAMPEVALGLFEDGHVEIVRGGKGQYEGPPGMRVATRIDIFWSEPHRLVWDDRAGRARAPRGSTLYGCDYKTGDERWVDPVEYNLQALAGAVLPAIWTGADHALPTVIYPGKGPGTWDTLEYPLDRDGIARGAALLLDVAERVNRERQKLQRGDQLAYVLGPWCRFCDAETFCGAKTAQLRGVIDSPEPYEDGVELSDEELSQLAAIVPSLKRFTTSAERAMRARVERDKRAIRLDDGRVWGPYEAPGRKIDPEIGFKVLEGVVGTELASKARKQELSGEAIERAVAAAHERDGVPRGAKAGAVRGIWAELIQLGGVQRGVKVKWGVHRDHATPAMAGAGEAPALGPAQIVIDEGGVDGDAEDEGDDK